MSTHVDHVSEVSVPNICVPHRHNSFVTEKKFWACKKKCELTSNAFVPLSIKSSFVNTPNVLSPKTCTQNDENNHRNSNNSDAYEYLRHQLGEDAKSVQKVPFGSTSRAILIASDVAISWLAGVMARIMQFGYNPITKSSLTDILISMLIKKGLLNYCYLLHIWANQFFNFLNNILWLPLCHQSASFIQKFEGGTYNIDVWKTNGKWRVIHTYSNLS